MQKRAQSQIITTILIILLVLAAIVIVWQVVRNTVESGSKNIEETSKCLSVQLTIDSVDKNGNLLKISRGSGGGTIDSIKVIADGTVKTTDAGALTPLGNNWAAPYSLGTTTPIDTVQIAAVIGETTCPIADTEKASNFITTA